MSLPTHQQPLCNAGILVLALPPRLPRLLPVNDSGGGGEGAIERGARCEGGREWFKLSELRRFEK